MTAEVSQDSALAASLQTVVQPKLAEMGWSTDGLDDSALSEYIILMLVNGKTQEQIATELSEDLLQLGPGDPGAQAFSKWLFEQVNILSGQPNGEAPNQNTEETVAQSADTNTAVAQGDDAEMDDAGANGASTIPTGPKAMRSNNSNPRDKRMLGNINKALERTGDAALHRVRGSSGTGRINSHSREPPKGPRNKMNRNIQQMANAGMPNMPMAGMMQNAMGGGMPQMSPAQQMEMMAYWEQGAKMMQQLINGGAQGGPVFNPAFQKGNQQHQGGKSLFDRVQRPNRNNRQSNKASNQDTEMGGASENGANTQSGMDFELSQPAKPPAETRCRFDLKCTNVDCAFVHQSPAAKPGTAIDMASDCSFGAACKNHKCAGKHPSPAKRTTFQSETDCEWGPLCKNPTCHFRHSTAPPCRNGGDCQVEGCTFAHTKIVCVHSPCTRPGCHFKHKDGQKRGNFEDKVWTPHEGGRSHVSERKFVDEHGEEELIIPGREDATQPEAIIT